MFMSSCARSTKKKFRCVLWAGSHTSACSCIDQNHPGSTVIQCCCALAGSSLSSTAAESTVSKWGEACLHVVFDDATGYCTETMLFREHYGECQGQRGETAHSSSVVSCGWRVRLSHIWTYFMDNLRTIRHALGHAGCPCMMLLRLSMKHVQMMSQLWSVKMSILC